MRGEKKCVENKQKAASSQKKTRSAYGEEKKGRGGNPPRCSLWIIGGGENRVGLPPTTDRKEVGERGIDSLFLGGETVWVQKKKRGGAGGGGKSRCGEIPSC